MNNQVAIIIIGASGSGKSTLEKDLFKLVPSKMLKVVSYTTRDIRLEDGEKDGETYHYVSREEFNEIPMVERVEFGGNLYGIAKVSFETDKDLICVVEPHGAEQIMEYIKDKGITPIVIYMDIPAEVRLENMKKRGDSEEKIAKRVSIDDIEKRFLESGIIAEKTVKKLTPNLTLDVYEFIQIFKKNIFPNKS